MRQLHRGLHLAHKKNLLLRRDQTADNFTDKSTADFFEVEK
jgi:hypothetical protein